MENITIFENNNNLLFETNPTKDYGLTKSGKSTIVAKSDGFHQFIHNGETFTLNFFLSKKASPKAVPKRK